MTSFTVLKPKREHVASDETYFYLISHGTRIKTNNPGGLDWQLIDIDVIVIIYFHNSVSGTSSANTTYLLKTMSSTKCISPLTPELLYFLIFNIFVGTYLIY